MSRVRFRVYGDPRPQGSKRAFVVKGRAVLTEASGENLKTWRGQVAVAAREARPDAPIEGPVRVAMRFFMRRPQKPKHGRPAGRPDLSKLARAVEDEMTGVVFRDDSQAVVLDLSKEYESDGQPPGVAVEVEALDD